MELIEKYKRNALRRVHKTNLNKVRHSLTYSLPTGYNVVQDCVEFFNLLNENI